MAAMDGTQVSIHEVVRRLNAALGPTLVAALAGTTDRTLPLEWVRRDGPEPAPDAQSRLRQALATWQTVAQVEGEHVARLWFIGANPRSATSCRDRPRPRMSPAARS
jgi:hypothetical protein